ncbi:GtrA family protein [Cytobacillus gottheilii]|uniref:GtrA family protein n=1 Tax=Cytobacillus gottheilii TaxID=859144 RepID=UPI0009B9AB9C|nr:GtrA family protein [Cytobacillus gottheilii]
MLNRATINYLFFGILTTAVNILVYALLVHIFHIDYKAATTVAWIISIIFAFFTNKLFVFNSKDLSINRTMKELGNFVFFRVLSLAVDLLIMFLLIDIFMTNDIVAKITANVVVIVINYVTSKYLTFRNK